MRYSSLLVLLFAFFSCTKKETIPVPVLSAVKQLTELTTSINGVTFKGTINESAQTVAFTIPYYFRSQVSSLSFGFRFTGKAISPAPDQPRDYSQPQKVTITADDNTSVDYTITVNIMPEYELTDFDKSSYLNTDSVRVVGKNLGVGRGLVAISLGDIASYDPFSGSYKTKFTIGPDKTNLNNTSLAFPIVSIPKGKYKVTAFFPDSDTFGSQVPKDLEIK